MMVYGSLLMDSFIEILQEAIFKMNLATSEIEMLFCSTAVGLLILIIPMVLIGELSKAWTTCSQYLYIYLMLIFEAMVTFVG